MFVRKKKIKGREYYYIVRSIRTGKNKWEKIERYIGINPPSKGDLKKFEGEFDKTKEFLLAKEKDLKRIKRLYAEKLKKGTKDELANLEEEIIIKFTYDTNRLEGSSLTYKDTKTLLQEGISPREKPLRDIKEAENHKKAFLYMKGCLSKEVTKEFMLDLHKLLKENVTEDAGRFRDARVSVGNLIPVRAEMIETELDNLLAWYEKNKKLHPLELASLFHSVFERIHPFFDGNGRVGRLLLNFILLKNGYLVVIIQNKNKRRYYAALRHADNGNYLYMIKYLFSELEKQAEEYYEK